MPKFYGVVTARESSFTTSEDGTKQFLPQSPGEEFFSQTDLLGLEPNAVEIELKDGEAFSTLTIIGDNGFLMGKSNDLKEAISLAGHSRGLHVTRTPPLVATGQEPAWGRLPISSRMRFPNRGDVKYVH